MIPVSGNIYIEQAYRFSRAGVGRDRRGDC